MKSECGKVNGGIEMREDQFASFLNGQAISDALVAMALEDVRDKSGLSAQILEDAGVRIFSGNSDDLKESLGFASIDKQPILKMARLVQFPSFDIDGTIRTYHFRLYPSVNGTRYLHPKDEPARPYILPSTWAVKDKAHIPLWVSEGAKKVLKLVQHGRQTIGLQGVWNFRDSQDTYLFDDLESFIWRGRSVYLGFDMDLLDNPQVRFALFELSLKLMSKGAVVRFPRWAGAKGIDDYLATHKDADAALPALEQKAQPFEKLVRPEYQDEILRALRLTHTAFDAIRRESLIRDIAKGLHIRPKRLFMELRDEVDKTPEATAEEREAALNLLRDPELVSRFLGICQTRYLGRSKILLLVKLACMTRHFERALSLVLSGASSTGKSALIETVLDTCWPEAVENFTRTSALYLLYRQEPLDHRIVTYFELQGTGQTTQIIRTALSEGTLRLGTVLKDDSGGLQAKQIEKDTQGLVILSTHTGYRLDQELSTRVLCQELTHDENLARRVYQQKAARNGTSNRTELKKWQLADSLIEARLVIIPYLRRFADLFPTKQERYHRDFEKGISLIKASALWHQYQRDITDDGAVIATRQDYELVFSLADVFTQSTLPVSAPVLKFLELLQRNPDITRREAEDILETTERSIQRYVSQAVKAQLLETDGRGAGQKFKVLDVPTAIAVLPSPEDVCGEHDLTNNDDFIAEGDA
jgi:hypothetical protein